MPIESTRVETLQYSGWRYKSGKQNYSIEEGFLCDSCPWKTAVDGVKIGVWFVYALILLSYFTAPSSPATTSAPSVMAASAKRKQEEKHLKMLREMTSLPANRKCFDCDQRGPTYANMTVGSFVCTTCSGIL